jgi:hypothetical protein
VLAHLGHHVVRQADQVELVGDGERVRQGVGDRAGVGRGQFDVHVRHPVPPPLGLGGGPLGDLGRGAFVDMGEQPAGAGGVHGALGVTLGWIDLIEQRLPSVLVYSGVALVGALLATSAILHSHGPDVLRA